MTPVILYGLSEDTLLDDVTVIIANLHGDNDHTAVRNNIKNHPKFKQSYQKLVEHLFKVLEKKLAPTCNQYGVAEIGFFLPSVDNGNPTALCNYSQTRFDELMALAYMPLHEQYADFDYGYDCGREGLEVAGHTYFLWEELDDEDTYPKIIKLFNCDGEEYKNT